LPVSKFKGVDDNELLNVIKILSINYNMFITHNMIDYKSHGKNLNVINRLNISNIQKCDDAS